ASSCARVRWREGSPSTPGGAVARAGTGPTSRGGPPAPPAGALVGVTGASAPDPRTLVVTYRRPVGNALSQLSQIYFLPQHVWAPVAGADGKGLQAYRVEQHLPLVGGGPLTVTRFAPKGTTVLKRTPGYFGKPPAMAALSFTYYTNSVAMLAAFKQGDISLIDQVPFDAVSAAKALPDTTVTSASGATVVTLL